MSIENAILELAAAIRELAGASSDRTKADTAAVEKLADKVEKTTSPAKKAVEDALAAAEKAKAEKAAVAKEEAKEEAPAALDYDKDVAPALTAYAKAQGRDKLVALLSKYQAKNGAGLKVADYAAVMADIDTESLV